MHRFIVWTVVLIFAALSVSHANSDGVAPPDTSALHAQVYTLEGNVSVDLSWEAPAVGVPKGYKIHVGNASGTYDKVFDVGLRTAYMLENLTPGETYFITATAYTANGVSSKYSNEVRITPPVEVTIGPPQKLKAPVPLDDAAPAARKKGK